uniref:EGF-like domain-containing protein n=1 Tax=Macrostomum lignano TaxID=282301 RepID=A0A1I8G0Z2_9PLAT
VAAAVGNDTTAFRGVLSSVRLNGDTPLLLGPVPTSLIDSLPTAVSAENSTEVTTGARTESVCVASTPCQNGGNCSDVFYNSYSCNCTAGWRGRNCSDRDLCHPSAGSCPNGTQCVNLDGSGRAAATFGSNLQSPLSTSQLILSASSLNESLATVTGWARTRQSDCQLLSVSSGGRQLTVGCSSGQLQAGLDNQTALVAVGIATGLPFTFSVNCSAGSPLSLQVSVNSSDSVSVSSKSALATDLLLDSAAKVTLGGIKFKGCLDNVRLNGRLAPLANRSLLPSGAAGFEWASELVSAPMIGCHGDQVCQTTVNERTENVCQNSGRCTDLWNKFACSCTDGFYGDTCSAKLGATASVSTAVIIAVSVVGLVIIISVVAVLLFKYVQNRRKESGTYGPSKAESRSNAHAQAQPPVRPPPEERLI